MGYGRRMSTPFLQGYARGLIRELVARELLEVADHRIEAVVDFVAAFLAEHGHHRSLIDLTGRALLACPDVDELYADDEALKDAVDALAR